MNTERNEKMYDVIKSFSELNTVQPKVDEKEMYDLFNTFKKKGWSDRRAKRAVERKLNVSLW